MLIDGFEKFQKNIDLSEEEIETLKITFIKESFNYLRLYAHPVYNVRLRKLSASELRNICILKVQKVL